MICDDCQKQDGCQYLPDTNSDATELICGNFFPKSELPIICRSCQAQFDSSCKYVGNPIRHVSSPEHFCTTYSAAIKDSGQRTSFPTGAVRDMHEGKGRYDLLPWDAIHELAIHCEQGAKKYGERNVDKGIPVHSFLDSAIRHISRYMQGDCDEKHAVAAAWNLLWAIHFEKTRPDLVDIPSRRKERSGEAE